MSTIINTFDQATGPFTSDGKVWQAVYYPAATVNTDGTLYMVLPAYDGTLYFFSSADGDNWNFISGPYADGWKAPFSPAMASMNGTLHIALPGNGNVIWFLSTTDCINWTQSGKPYTLSNGILWQSPFTPAMTGMNGTLYMALPGEPTPNSRGATIYFTSSTDGINWTDVSGPYTAPDGSVWNAPYPPSLTSIGDTLYMALPGNPDGGIGGSTVYLLSSTDGINWTILTGPFMKGWYAPFSPSLTAMSGLLYLALPGSDGLYFTSSQDGTNWLIPVGPYEAGWKIPFAPALTAGPNNALELVLGGQGNQIYFSQSASATASAASPRRALSAATR